jgi:hypothetical protein
MEFKEKVFLGFQFRSDYYDRSTLEELLVDSVVNASNELKDIGLKYVTLEPLLIDLKPSEGVTEGIIRHIDSSIFAIFEISDNNPNVMFELGNAYAKNKGLIFLKNATSKEKIPSDIIGKYIVQYGGERYPKLADLRPKITKTIRENVQNLYEQKSETWIRKVWDISGEKLMVVSGNLNGKYEVEPRDADALFESTLKLVNLYPGLKVHRYYSIDFDNKDYQNNDLLLMGGPDSNKVTKEVLEGNANSFPFEFIETDDDYEFILKDKSTSMDYKKHFNLGKITKDYGFFAKMPNPFCRGKNVILLAGIGGEGTLACSRALPSDNNWLFNYYHENFSCLDNKQYFTFICEANVEGTNVKGRILKDSIHYFDIEESKAWKKL